MQYCGFDEHCHLSFHGGFDEYLNGSQRSAYGPRSHWQLPEVCKPTPCAVELGCPDQARMFGVTTILMVSCTIIMQTWSTLITDQQVLFPGQLCVIA